MITKFQRKICNFLRTSDGKSVRPYVSSNSFAYLHNILHKLAQFFPQASNSEFAGISIYCITVKFNFKGIVTV